MIRFNSGVGCLGRRRESGVGWPAGWTRHRGGKVLLASSRPEAKEGQDAWREGNLSFEEAIMEVVKSLFLAKEETQHRLDHALSPSQENH
jgi:hypothetical protein